ncbi:MAG TPA: hypothetical protein VF557_03710 [Jatrophihabitans sp.]|jgi:hypothetical protein|uniref:hypothetical protein n=1 Tax=Jatrophihabitans sp. TaxID=1932789 RepID=UPI002F0BD732
MVTAMRLSERIDVVNDEFTDRVKSTLLARLPSLSTEVLEWLVMEHYQFSFTNVELLGVARDATAKLANPGVAIELQRNMEEENGHAAMYRRAMRLIGTDVDERQEFPPTSDFFVKVRDLSGPAASRALGALYATETAAIFEHQVFYAICEEICARRDVAYQGSLIKKFHDIHLDEGVEQGHKDGLAAFVDEPGPAGATGEPIDSAELEQGAYDAIAAMTTWWDALLAEVDRKSKAA